MGDGGVLLTSDPQLAERARRLRNYGQAGRYDHVEPGLNSRLDELHAAILRSALLPRLNGWLRRRAEIAHAYSAELEQSSRLRPIRTSGGSSADHLYPVEVRDGDRERWLEGLAAAGIGAGVHYPFLCPDAPANQGRGVVLGDLAVARRIAERELSLPLHPQMSDAAIAHVLETCREIS
jgi:dTDP-4-amino-4,6-dideoxygalactose transaminase